MSLEILNMISKNRIQVINLLIDNLDLWELFEEAKTSYDEKR